MANGMSKKSKYRKTQERKVLRALNNKARAGMTTADMARALEVPYSCVYRAIGAVGSRYVLGPVHGPEPKPRGLVVPQLIDACLDKGWIDERKQWKRCAQFETRRQAEAFDRFLQSIGQSMTEFVTYHWLTHPKVMSDKQEATRERS